MSKGQGSRVLITGASSGIGKATALYLAQKGHPVIATGRAMARLADLGDEARESDLPIAIAELDVNSDEEVDRTVPELVAEHGPIDVLVNNAGYGLWGPVQLLSVEQVKQQLETNFFGALRMIKAVLPGMVDRSHGTIINVSSVQGRFATAFNGAYAASKFAMEGISEALRAELWPLGVRVAVVEPGIFRTRFHAGQVVTDEVVAEETPYAPYLRRYAERVSRFERRAGDPVKVAKVIHKIVRSRRPGFRHPVGLEARLGLLGLRLLPGRLFRTMVDRATIS